MTTSHYEGIPSSKVFSNARSCYEILKFVYLNFPSLNSDYKKEYEQAWVTKHVISRPAINLGVFNCG